MLEFNIDSSVIPVHAADEIIIADQNFVNPVFYINCHDPVSVLNAQPLLVTQTVDLLEMRLLQLSELGGIYHFRAASVAGQRNDGVFIRKEITLFAYEP